MQANKFAPKATETRTAAHVEAAPEEVTRSAAPTRFVPDNIEDVQRMARMFYFGGLMKKHFYRDPTPEGVRNAIAGIATMIIYGAELGFSPTQAFRTMHVIEGAPTLSASGKVALVKRSPKCYSFEVIDESDEHCTCETVRLRNDGTKMPPRRLTVRVWWKAAKDIPAATPGVVYVMPSLDKHGQPTQPWARTPGRMVKARCSSWLCDNVYEDVTMGLYSTEEIIDFADRRSSERMVEDIFAMVDDAPAQPGRVEASDEEPAAPPVAPETPQDAPVAAKPGLTPADLKALMERVRSAGDGVSAEEVAKMRAEVRAFEGVAPIGFPKLVEAWNANEALGPFEVAS